MGHGGSGLEDALGGGHALAAQGLRGLQGSGQCFQLVRRQIAGDQNILRLRGAAADGLSHQAEHLSVRAAIGAALHLIELCIQLSGLLGAVAGQCAQHGQAGGAVQLAGRVDHAVQQEPDHDHAAGKHTAQQEANEQVLCHRGGSAAAQCGLLRTLPSTLSRSQIVIQRLTGTLQFHQLALQILNIFIARLLQRTQFRGDPLCHALINHAYTVAAHSSCRFIMDQIQTTQQRVQNFLCGLLICSIHLQGHHAVILATVVLGKFYRDHALQVAHIYPYGISGSIHGVTADQLFLICSQQCTGRINILIRRTRLDFVAAVNIKVSLRRPDIINIQIF